MQIQYTFGNTNDSGVVICFKFSNFAYANTVNLSSLTSSTWLLFALNLVTLLMQIQYSFRKTNSIDLLLFALNLVTLLMQIQF